MNMNKIGTITGVLGIVFCVGAIIGRFFGPRAIFEVQAINIFIVGIGLMVLGCFAKLSGR